jgi:hypothetical protein
VELLLVELLTANFDHVLMLFLGLSAIELMMMNQFRRHSHLSEPYVDRPLHRWPLLNLLL